jgi:crotonobetainyl-CoA:carnitine CoA-transferase CaiB-like acyl-CoA transferase
LAPSFVTSPRRDWERLLEQNDVPYAPVNSFEDIANDPQVQHLGTFFDVHHPEKGSAKSTARPVLYNGDREFDAAAAPMLGEHTDTLLSGLGYTPDDIQRLRAAAVI